MKPRKLLSIQRRLTRLFRTWRDPHAEHPLSETDQIRGVEVSDEGIVQIVMVPERPHCPCCLYDLKDLREKIQSLRGVAGVQLKITDVPAAERWTRVLNPE